MQSKRTQTKSDRMLNLFLSGSLYSTIEPRTALLIEIILSSGATPKDIIDLSLDDFDTTAYRLTIHVNKKKTVAPHTISLSKQAILTALKYPQFSKLSVRRIQQLIKEAALELKSIYTTPRSLRQLYLAKTLTQETTNLTVKTQLTSLRHKRILNKEELKKLRGLRTTTRNSLLIETLLATGIRISELLQLQQHHVGHDTLHLPADISYNNKERTVSISAELAKKLQNSPTCLFCSNRGKALTQRRFEQICKELATQAGIAELSPTILRSTAISLLSTQLSQKELQKQTGLNTPTLYTYGVMSGKDTGSITTTLADLDVDPRKDSTDVHSSRSQYVRSRLRKGGDSDE